MGEDSEDVLQLATVNIVVLNPPALIVAGLHSPVTLVVVTELLKAPEHVELLDHR